MKIVLSILFISFSPSLQAQEFSNPDLQSLVNTERAFSLMAKERNKRDAFLANLNDGSIFFSQGITPAKKFWENLPVESDWLYWLPVYADISVAGDLGYTFGPWSYRKQKTDDKPMGFGHYVTVWQKQVDGQWKIAVDVGINHQEYLVDGHPTQTSTTGTSASKTNLKKEFDEAEGKFTEACKSNESQAYALYASSEIKIFRQGSLPLSSINEATRGTGFGLFKTANTVLSTSNDLGFSYGTVISESLPDHQVTTKYFLRIWKKENGNDWKIVLDLIS